METLQAYFKTEHHAYNNLKNIITINTARTWRYHNQLIIAKSPWELKK